MKPVNATKDASQKLDAYDWHEALDRTSICMEMVDRYVLFHPAIESTETLKAKAEAAHRLLFELYQEIGRLVMDKDN